MRFWLGLFLAISGVAISLSAQADTVAMTMLERMIQATRQLNYQGVFAYQTGRNLQSIRIIHKANNDGEVERLISLNGAAREVIRSNDLVTCIIPDGKKINIRRHPLGRGFPGDLPRRLSSATPYYQVKTGTDGRVADRQATALVITPVDNYRYGYRLWVDKETNLLLKSELVADNGDVLETFAFSSLKTNVDIPDTLLKPQTSGEEMTWNRTEPEIPAKVAEQISESKWHAVWLPDGFTLVALQNRLRSSSGAPVEQLVYSDGLSTVSVFIEKIQVNHSHLQGATHVGAVNAYGTVKQAHLVTVVGEVPSATVEKIGSGLKFGDGVH